MTFGQGRSTTTSGGPACPLCGLRESAVKDSRPAEMGSVRRRRFCKCGHRFTTYETLTHPKDRGLSETQKKILQGMLGTLTNLVKQLAP